MAGNVGLDQTTANALRVRDFLGMRDVPVGRLPRAAAASATHARHVHGIPVSARPASRRPPPGPPTATRWTTWRGRSRAEPGEITLIAIGPLTNIALAVRRYPDLVTQVKDFVIMGGSAGRGT